MRSLQTTGPGGIDQVDEQILGALEINPRASWTLIGRVLELDPVTVARRWERMSEAGIAWLSAYLVPATGDTPFGALVEINCVGGKTRNVALAIAEHPNAINVKLMAGGRDLIVTVEANGMDDLTAYLSEVLDGVPGIASRRSSVMTDVMIEGSSWRTDTLGRQQQSLMRPQGPKVAATERLSPSDFEIINAVAANPRISLKDLAEECGISAATVRRRLTRLLASGTMVIRTDIARPLSQTPIAATYFIEAAPAALGKAAAQIATLPGVRLCLTVAGAVNLVVDIWVHDLVGVKDFEVLLGRQSLPIRVRDRSVVLRTVKHLGRILDQHGRIQRHVLYDFRPQADAVANMSFSRPNAAGISDPTGQ